MLAECLGEVYYLFRLLTDATVHRAGETDYNLLDLVLINDTRNRLNIQPLISTVDNCKRAG